MKFFLDTASIDDIKRWTEVGVVQGVTTNPALLSKEGSDPLAQLKTIAGIVDGPVSAQVTFDAAGNMVTQGRALARIAENIIIKLPANLEGYRAAKQLVSEAIKCNITLVFDPAQAIPFCILPVTYVSLIIGRVEDFGLRSLDLARQLRDLIDTLRSSTQLLAASIRNSHHLIAAIRSGSDVITVPPSTWLNIFGNPLTLSGERDFFNAWKQLPEELVATYQRPE